MAHLRELDLAVRQGHITYSRQCEILNHICFYAYNDGITKSDVSIQREFNDSLYGIDKKSFS